MPESTRTPLPFTTTWVVPPVVGVVVVAGLLAAADLLEPEHPALRHLGASWPWHDEVYQFRDLRADARVLLRVPDNELDLSAPDAQRPHFGFPLSWCFTEGDGRVFSTTLGHFPGACESVDYLRHLAGGLAWAMGEGK